MHVTIRRIGNSQGFVIPKPLLTQVGLEGEAEMTIEGGPSYFENPQSLLVPDGQKPLRRLQNAATTSW